MLAFPPRDSVPGCELPPDYATKGFTFPTQEHLYYLHLKWVRKDSAFAVFEKLPISYFAGNLEIAWAPGPDNYVNVPPHAFHATYAKTIKSKILDLPTTERQQDAAVDLIERIVLHHKVALANYIFHMESHGWDDSHYKDWFTEAKCLYATFPIEFENAKMEGRALRAKWQAAADATMLSLRRAMETVVVESRSDYLRWLVAEGLTMNKATKSTVKLENPKLSKAYTELAPYSAQSAAHQAILDEWVGSNFKGQDADGLKMQSDVALGGMHSYVGWLNACVSEILTKTLIDVGSPPVDPAIFQFGSRDKNFKYTKAATYWPDITVEWQSENRNFDLLAGGNPEVVAGQDSSVVRHIRDGPVAFVYSVYSKYLLYFVNKQNLYITKPNFKGIVENAKIPEFPNRGWKRPIAYEPPPIPVPEVKKVITMPPTAPEGADIFLEWPNVFENVFQVDSAFQQRLQVLEKWRDKVRKAVADEEDKRKNEVVWDPYNENPKDLVEAAIVYGQRIAEWSSKSKQFPTGHPTKLQEIQTWYANKVAALSKEVGLNFNTEKMFSN